MDTTADSVKLKVIVEEHRLVVGLLQLAVSNATLEPDRKQLTQLIQGLTRQLEDLRLELGKDQPETLQLSEPLRTFVDGLTRHWVVLARVLEGDIDKLPRRLRQLRRWCRCQQSSLALMSRRNCGVTGA